MNKTFYAIVVPVCLLMLVIGVTWYVQNSDHSTDTVTDAFYTDPTISLPVSQEENIVIDNFLKDESVTLDQNNPGTFFLGNTFDVSPITGGLPPYVIVYEEQSGYFNVALLQKPFVSARSEAELYLKKLLGLDEATLCGLSYTLTIPGYVDEIASGTDYRFSFCADRVPL